MAPVGSRFGSRPRTRPTALLLSPFGVSYLGQVARPQVRCMVSKTVGHPRLCLMCGECRPTAHLSQVFSGLLITPSAETQQLFARDFLEAHGPCNGLTLKIFNLFETGFCHGHADHSVI